MNLSGWRLGDAAGGGEEDADDGEDAGDDPEAHDDFGFAPAFGLEVVVDGGGDEDFAVEEFFRDHLEEGRAGFDDEEDADNGEEEEGISHHGDDAEAGAEGKGTDVAHHEAGGWDVEPNIREEPADDGKTETAEHPLTLEDGDDAESAVGDKHEAAGETVESIGNINSIGGSDDGKSEDCDHEGRANIPVADEGDVDAGPAKFISEEPTEEEADDGNHGKLNGGTETGGAFTGAENID